MRGFTRWPSVSATCVRQCIASCQAAGMRVQNSRQSAAHTAYTCVCVCDKHAMLPCSARGGRAEARPSAARSREHGVTRQNARAAQMRRLRTHPPHAGVSRHRTGRTHRANPWRPGIRASVHARGRASGRTQTAGAAARCRPRPHPRRARGAVRRIRGQCGSTPLLFLKNKNIRSKKFRAR